MRRLWCVGGGGAPLVDVLCHDDWVRAIAFSPDGARLASCSGDELGMVFFVPPAVATGRGGGGMTEDADGAVAITGSGCPVVAAADLGGVLLAGHTGWVCTVAWSPDGQRVATGSADAAVRVWDAASGAMTRRMLRLHSGCVRAVAFSPDGARLASGDSDCGLLVCDVASGACLHAVVLPYALRSVSWLRAAPFADVLLAALQGPVPAARVVITRAPSDAAPCALAFQVHCGGDGGGNGGGVRCAVCGGDRVPLAICCGCTEAVCGGCAALSSELVCSACALHADGGTDVHVASAGGVDDCAVHLATDLPVRTVSFG